MNLVLITRIFDRRCVSGVPFPQQSRLCSATVFTLPLIILLFSDLAKAGTLPGPDNSETGGRVFKADTTLQTCCSHQSNYDIETGKCLHPTVNVNDPAQQEKFPDVLTIPDKLVSSVYRTDDFVWDRTFRLTSRAISCPSGTLLVNVSLASEDNDKPRSKHIVKGTFITPVNGFLRNDFDVFYPDEYCFNKINADELEILICKPDCSEIRPCVRKCCDAGQVLNLTNFPSSVRCGFAGENHWSPEVYSDVWDEMPLDYVRPHIIVHHPRQFCHEESTVHRLKPFMDEKRTPFRILQTGETWYKIDRRKWGPFSAGEYCIDGSFVANEDLDNNVGSYSGSYQDTIVWDCGPPLVPQTNVRTSELYGVSLIIAAFFMLITIVVYYMLWEKQNVHGWTLLCYFTSLFFMYIFYAAVHFTSLSLHQDGFSGGGPTCYIIGVCAHFFFLSSFCFMSSVNFDLYWTFRALMPTGGKSKGLKKFFAYNVFSLGVPATIVGVGITLDHLYRDDPDSYVIVPEYGKTICYLDRHYATLPYRDAPAGILLSCNLAFFTVTVYTMYKIQQSTKFATMNSSKKSKQRQSMVLFAKLFLVMGLPWIFEVVSSATQEGRTIPIFFQITDMINIFQSIAIFIIFVLKTDIRNSLESKYPLFHRFMLAVTIRPESADSILRKHPKLRFIINPLTRSTTSTRSFSTAKTTLSNGTEGSMNSRANVLGRNSDAFELTTSSSGSNSPSGSLGGHRSERRKSKHLEILELT